MAVLEALSSCTFDTPECNTFRETLCCSYTCPCHLLCIPLLNVSPRVRAISQYFSTTYSSTTARSAMLIAVPRLAHHGCARHHPAPRPVFPQQPPTPSQTTE